MTARQRDVLEVIVAAWLAGGPLPTLRALMAWFGWASTNAASEHVDRLTVRGVLTRPHQARGYGINLQHPEVAAIVARAKERRAS